MDVVTSVWRGALGRVSALALLLALALAPQAEAGQDGWSEPIDLSPGYLYSNGDLAPDAGGGFIHTWNETIEGEFQAERPMFARPIPPNGPPGPIQPLNSFTSARGGEVASDGKGNALLAWVELTDCCFGLAAAVKEPDEDFSEPVPLGNEDSFIVEVRVAMNENGDGIIVYEEAGTDDLHAIFRPADGEFSAPIPVSAPGQYRISGVQAEMADNGEAIVAWSTEDRETGRYSVYGAVGTDAGFETPQTLSDPNQGSWNWGLDVDAQGGSAVAFQSYEDGGTEAYVAIRKPGEAFGEALSVGPLAEVGSLDVGVDNRGRGYVASTPNNEMEVRPIDTRTARVGEPTALEGGSGWGRLTVAADGRAMVAFDSALLINFPEGTFSYTPVMAAWGDTDAGFMRVRPVSCAGGSFRLHGEPVIGETNGAVPLLDHGENMPSDQDDRDLIVRSDPSVEPLTTDCEERPPKISLKVPQPRRTDEKGRIRVLAETDEQGMVSAWGWVRIGGHRYTLADTAEEPSGPGLTELHLEPSAGLKREMKGDPIAKEVHISGLLRIGGIEAQDDISAKVLLGKRDAD